MLSYIIRFFNTISMSTSNLGKSRECILRDNSTNNTSNNTAKYHNHGISGDNGSICILMKIHIIYITSKVLPQPTNLHKYIYPSSVVGSFVVRSMSPKGRKRMGGEGARLVNFTLIGRLDTLLRFSGWVCSLREIWEKPLVGPFLYITILNTSSIFFNFSSNIFFFDRLSFSALQFSFSITRSIS